MFLFYFTSKYFQIPDYFLRFPLFSFLLVGNVFFYCPFFIITLALSLNIINQSICHLSGHAKAFELFSFTFSLGFVFLRLEPTGDAPDHTCQYWCPVCKYMYIEHMYPAFPPFSLDYCFRQVSSCLDKSFQFFSHFYHGYMFFVLID